MSGVWVFKNNGVIRLVDNPATEQEGRNGSLSSRRKVLVHLPSGQTVSSYDYLEQILIGLGWERYYGGDPDLFQFHKHSSIDLISLPPKMIVQITSAEGITPLTLALAVATKQTAGGRFICIIPHHCHSDHETVMINNRSYIELINPDLKDVIEFAAGNPYEIIRQFKKINFIVIDSEFGDRSKLWKNIDVNPKGSLLVVTNLLRGRKNVFRGIVKGKHETITVPVGDGIELIKIPPLLKPGRTRRYRRFHVTCEN